MAQRIKLGSVAVGLLISLGCEQTPTGEEPPTPVLQFDGLLLDVALDRSVIPAGDSGTLTFRLVNESNAAATLNFPSTCQILPYVETAAGTVLYPSGGAWACGYMLTSLSVPARGSITRTLVLRGAATGTGGVAAGSALAPGRYRAYALLDFVDQTPPSLTPRRLRSPTLEFEVR